jgi:hypothetical protein
MDEQALTALFARLGAPHPSASARSQIREGIPQLARFLFLRQAWREVVADGDATWIERELQAKAGQPGGAVAPALRRLLALGAQKEDLTTVVRIMQWQLLFSFCYLLEDPGDIEPEVQDIAWALFQVDQDGNPIGHIGGLHESVLATEPNGQEMRGP